MGSLPLSAGLPGRGERLLLLYGACQSLCTSGLIFGWPALVKMLKDEGLYAGLCASGEASDCSARKQRFSSMFLLAQAVFTVSMSVGGVVLDRVGPKKVAVFGLSLELVGTASFAAASEQRDIFLPALCVMCSGGALVHISWFHLSNLFPGRQRTVHSFVVGVFVLSGIDWAVFEALVSGNACTRLQVFAGHAVLVAFFLVCSVRLWPWSNFELGDRIVFDGFLRYQVIPAPRAEQPTAQQRKESEQGEGAEARRDKDAETEARRAQVRTMGVWEQLRLPSCRSVVTFFAINYLFFVFMVGTAIDQLEAMGDKNHSYLRLFAIFLPLGALFGPLFGLFLDTRGFAAGFTFVLVCSVVAAALGLIDSLEVQVVRFLLFAVFRVCLFSSMFAFVGITYGFKSFGTLSGVCLSSGALLSLLSIPLAAVVEDRLDGRFFWVNFGLLLTALPLSWHPYAVHRWRW